MSWDGEERGRAGRGREESVPGDAASHPHNNEAVYMVTRHQGVVSTWAAPTTGRVKPRVAV